MTAPEAVGSPAYRYVLLNKPRGVLTAKRRDPSNLSLPTVIEHLADAGFPEPALVSPVGRLDAESEGLLLLTDDGKRTTLMIHPAHGCRKVYLAVVRGRGRPTARRRCSAEWCARLIEEGAWLKPGSPTPLHVHPTEVAMLSHEEADALLGGALQSCLGELARPPAPGASAADAADAAELDFVRVVLCEGKRHEVRQMLRAGGFSTLRLVRVAHGPLHDAELLARSGAWRHLRAEEVASLPVPGGSTTDER